LHNPDTDLKPSRLVTFPLYREACIVSQMGENPLELPLECYGSTAADGTSLEEVVHIFALCRRGRSRGRLTLLSVLLKKLLLSLGGLSERPWLPQSLSQ